MKNKHFKEKGWWHWAWNDGCVKIVARYSGYSKNKKYPHGFILSSGVFDFGYSFKNACPLDEEQIKALEASKCLGLGVCTHVSNAELKNKEY